MLLSNLLSLNYQFYNLTDTEKWIYLQKAYTITVNSISLDPAIFPCLMLTNNVNVDKLEYPALRTNGSEIAFKEIRDIIRCSFGSDDSIESNTNRLLVGELSEEYFGFTETQYNECNAEHETMPILFNSKQYMECSNFDDIGYPMFHICAYQYPYPLTHIDGYELEHRYDISWMIEEYGIDKLEVDDTVGILMLMKACQFVYEDLLNLNSAKHYDYMFVQFINLFNSNKESIRNNRTTTLGMMTWQV